MKTKLPPRKQFDIGLRRMWDYNRAVREMRSVLDDGQMLNTVVLQRAKAVEAAAKTFAAWVKKNITPKR